MLTTPKHIHFKLQLKTSPSSDFFYVLFVALILVHSFMTQLQLQGKEENPINKEEKGEKGEKKPPLSRMKASSDD